MNDLDLVREMRADVPAPTRTQLAPGRARLVAALSPPPRRRRLSRAILPVAVAGTAALAAVAVSISGTGPSVHKPLPAGPSLTARLLDAASATVARQPAVRPRPHQWIYTKSVYYSYRRGSQRDENWMTFDGRKTAYFQGGRLIVHTGPGIPGRGGTPLGRYDNSATPLTAYDALASLPSDPHALLAVIAGQVARLGPGGMAPGSVVSLGLTKSRAVLEFDYLTQLLWNATAGEPPAAEAAVFRALARIPGVSVQQGIIDGLGRPAVGLSATGGRSQLLLAPRTYQVTGMRQVSTGHDPVRLVKRGKVYWPAKGTVITSIASARPVLVRGPGQR